MKKYIRQVIFLFISLLSMQSSYAQTEKYAALAVDRNNGFYYGFANDYSSRADAEQRALLECKKRGGNCSIVLVFSGEGCAVYRTIEGNVGTAYGWGLAKTRQEADAIATAEAKKRSNGIAPTNHAWVCNSSNNLLKDLTQVSTKELNTVESSTALSSKANEYLSFAGHKKAATGDCGEGGNGTIGADDDSFSAILYNLPAKGTVNISAKMFTEACNSCPAIILTDANSMESYVATSGSISRDGNTISFTATVVPLLEIASGGAGRSLRGSFVCEN